MGGKGEGTALFSASFHQGHGCGVHFPPSPVGEALCEKTCQREKLGGKYTLCSTCTVHTRLRFLDTHTHTHTHTHMNGFVQTSPHWQKPLCILTDGQMHRARSLSCAPLSLETARSSDLFVSFIPSSVLRLSAWCTTKW